MDSVEIGIDTDSDGIKNYRDLDSDQDLCSDVIEAGFTDVDGDAKFGNSPITVDAKGLVIGAPLHNSESKLHHGCSYRNNHATQCGSNL